MNILIRRFTDTDIPACAFIMSENKLWQRYNVTFEAAAKRFSTVDPNKDTVFIAESDSKVLGFCWFLEKGAFNRSGYIQLIGVDPTCQGHGIGEMMLDAAEEIAFSKGNDMFLTVSDFNHTAQAFYQRQGYQQIGAIPAYVLPDVTELIYRKHKTKEAENV